MGTEVGFSSGGATYQVIVAFYDALKETGVSKAEALRRARPPMRRLGRWLIPLPMPEAALPAAQVSEWDLE